MFVSSESDDYEPLTWVRGIPVYATTLLVVSHCVALLLGWLAVGMGAGGVLEWLRFSSADVFAYGAVWQWVTYAWVQPLSHPLFFAIEMLLLYLFGREVERTMGRRHYLFLYALLVVTSPLLLTLAGWFHPFELAGSGHVHFAVFIGFALLYPGVEFFLRIRAIWLAVAFLALYGVYYLATHQWAAFGATAASALTVWLFVQWLRGEGLFAPAPEGEPEAMQPVGDPVEAIDPLLEKIAREGMASLTAREMAALERAREELLSRQPR